MADGSDTTRQIETEIPCDKCRYSLIGLPRSGNCPECKYPISVSVMRAAVRAVRPLPRWLRLLRLAYFTSWLVLLFSPLTATMLMAFLRIPGSTYKNPWFDKLRFDCGCCCLLVGIVLLVCLTFRRQPMAWVVAATILIGWFAFLPPMGYT